MKIIHTIEEVQSFLEQEKKANKTIGFVPTMGALHQGHISLVDTSKKNNDVTVVSIFVNPTQFNNTDDLKKYPRMFEKDVDLLKKSECDIVFAPSETEMYPEKDQRFFDFGTLDKVMEAKFRPGHFNGVAQIVSKFFYIIKPTKAYFGIKDFQQLAIIKQLNKKYLSELNIEIIACDIVREKDGLAMSSRNLRLSNHQRMNAAKISQILFNARDNKNQYSIFDLKKWVINQIDTIAFLKTEYFEIVNEDNLTPIESWSDSSPKRACIAVWCGDIRLIDNIDI